MGCLKSFHYTCLQESRVAKTAKSVMHTSKFSVKSFFYKVCLFSVYLCEQVLVVDFNVRCFCFSEQLPSFLCHHIENKRHIYTKTQNRRDKNMLVCITLKKGGAGKNV